MVVASSGVWRYRTVPILICVVPVVGHGRCDVLLWMVMAALVMML